MTNRNSAGMTGMDLAYLILIVGGSIAVRGLVGEEEIWLACILMSAPLGIFWVQFRLSGVLARICNREWRQELAVTPIVAEEYLRDTTFRTIGGALVAGEGAFVAIVMFALVDFGEEDAVMVLGALVLYQVLALFYCLAAIFDYYGRLLRQRRESRVTVLRLAFTTGTSLFFSFLILVASGAFAGQLDDPEGSFCCTNVIVLIGLFCRVSLLYRQKLKQMAEAYFLFE